MEKQNKNQNGRRAFLKKSLKASLAGSLIVSGFPTIVPAKVLGKYAPSNLINVGAIGVGRISRIHDLPGIMRHEFGKVVAVCDLDTKRAEDGKKLVNDFYTQKTGKEYNGVNVYHDYTELLKDKDVDAVVISTPDHWHALIGIRAAAAGKHIYMQKPAALTVTEGRTLVKAIEKSGVKFQIGSQQRSSEQFRFAAEIVRNGRIGQLQTVYVGLPGDPSGEEEPEMPVPANLNYDMWLGSTPSVYYTEKRVHPQNSYDRPGWLRCEQFGAGMITGWGSHHIDSAHWAMNMQHSGPVEIWGKAEFPTKGLWDVHGIFKTEALYADGVKMVVSNELPNGIRFEGSKGWIFVTRGAYQATASDPVPNAEGVKPLDASDLKIITTPTSSNEIKLPVSKDHHANWLDSIKANTQPIAPVEDAHRSCSACLIHHIAMKVNRKLYWDPKKEEFKNDAEANSMLSRKQREPYSLNKL